MYIPPVPCSWRDKWEDSQSVAANNQANLHITVLNILFDILVKNHCVYASTCTFLKFHLVIFTIHFFQICKTSGSTAAGTTAGQATTTAASATTGAQQSGCRCGIEKSSRIVGGTAINPVNKNLYKCIKNFLTFVRLTSIHG